MKKNNAWNIRRLGDESFVPSTHSDPSYYIEDCRIFFLLFARQNNSIFCLVAQMVDVMEILKYEVRLIRL